MNEKPQVLAIEGPFTIKLFPKHLHVGISECGKFFQMAFFTDDALTETVVVILPIENSIELAKTIERRVMADAQ